MARPDRRHLAAAGLVGATLILALVLVAFGLDALSLVLGGAIVAVAFVVILPMWLDPLVEARRTSDRRERKAQRRTQERDARIRREVQDSERRLFSQLEALMWLRDELDLPHPLPPTRGYAAAPDALLELIRLIDETGPETILELGSGVSTIVAAARLKHLGRGRLVALEHERAHADATRRHLQRQGLEQVAMVVDAPLTETRIGTEPWRWYPLGPEVPDRIDLLFVDGPPGSTGALARYPALPLLRDRLAPGAAIFVDDGARTDEREMVRRWSTEYEGLGLEELPLTKGAWIVRMPEGPGAGRPSPAAPLAAG